jgi:hypothetical protein
MASDADVNAIEIKGRRGRSGGDGVPALGFSVWMVNPFLVPLSTRNISIRTYHHEIFSNISLIP